MGGHMEDLDEKPSRFHELNNAIHAIAVTTAVINKSQEAQVAQANRIETAVSSVNQRLDRFDIRMNDIEKSQIGTTADLEKQIAEVKTDVQGEVSRAIEGLKSQTDDLRTQMALFSPVKLIVYGAVVLILTAFANVWITNTMISRQAEHLAAPRVP